MCGRFTLQTPTATIGSLFPELTIPNLPARYNIAPTQQVACVRGIEDASHEFAALRWGLVPRWAKDLKIGANMINARAETVATKPAFRAAFKKRRCLVFADGYYEWKKDGDEKQPFHITCIDRPTGFGMAGLWEKWQSPETGDVVQTCTIITANSVSSISSIHDRMPVIMNPHDFACWLDCSFAGTEQLQSLLKPNVDSEFQATAVSNIVNSSRHDSPVCLSPI